MNDSSITAPRADRADQRPPDDAPSGHSSMDLIVPEHESTPARTETTGSRPGAPDSTFRDAVEYQGRAQDLEETGLPDLPPAEAYDTEADGPPRAAEAARTST
jgi:hypothetical protein